MTGLSSLPSETIEELLIQSDPFDVAAVAQTCRLYRSLIYHAADSKIWRGLYLSEPLDDPRTCRSQSGILRTTIDWKGELQRIMRARTCLEKPEDCRPEERSIVLSTLLDMVSYVPPLSSSSDHGNLSKNLLWVAVVLRGGVFLDQVDWIPSHTESQLRARLHTYYGLTHNDAKKSSRVLSRAYVYALRNYRRDNDFGPFQAGNQCVDWVHLQALHHVVSMHLVALEDEDFSFTIFPLSLPYIQSVIPPGVDLDLEVDWADVEGTWSCTFLFCDHRDLIRYNGPWPDRNPLDPSVFEEADFVEVLRSIEVVLAIYLTTPDPDHPTRPKLHFRGKINSSEHTLTGWVKMTPDDQIRWHFVSGESGSPIWSSEGVQIGGVRSSFGVLGSWTTVDHDRTDPVGPWWLRKSSVLD